MKQQRSERWIIFPFSFGCASQSSIAADAPTPPSNHNHPTLTSTESRPKNSAIIKKTKHPLGFGFPKTNLSHGIQRLIKSFKSVSHFFVYKDEADQEEEEEIEIGYPTDVKHLTHIGWDGSTTISNAANRWENLTPPEMVSFPSISLKQFEVAMAKQAALAPENKHV